MDSLRTCARAAYWGTFEAEKLVVSACILEHAGARRLVTPAQKDDACAEGRRLRVFPVCGRLTLAVLQIAVLILFLKYLEPLVFKEASLRFSCRLATL